MDATRYLSCVPALIGEGSFSQVFYGRYQGSEVAVKRLQRPISAHDKNYFKYEVKSA